MIEYMKRQMNNNSLIKTAAGGLFKVLIINDLPENINVDNVVNYIVENIPTEFMKFEEILVGNFPELVEKQVNAAYMDGAIYLTNAQSSEGDMIDDIIHEIAHALEDHYGSDIYQDDKISIEYLKKMKYVHNKLKQESSVEPPEENDFLSLDYNEEKDDYLFKELGYSKVNRYSAGLFVSPYSLTSLKEYWATGFEEYYLGDIESLKITSPAVYNKIKSLLGEV